jgi:hypothetical protein
MQMNQLTSELLLTEIERVLQSNEQFVLDHCVQLNITHASLPKGVTGKRCDYVDTEKFLKDKRCIIQIQNKDDMCCARAIVTAKSKIERSHAGNHIVVVVVIVQVDLLLGCGSMVNDSVEMLSRYHMYLISYQESLKRFYIFDSALM